jgi:GH24 family phage-related lysozyme (muramidase)
MAQNNPVKDLIDEKILRILGLFDVFDLDYETYATLLKEKLVEVTSARKKIPAEEFDLLKNEFKRVRGKSGRFKPQKKKINANKISSLPDFAKKTQKLIGGVVESKVKEGQPTKNEEGILGIVKSIRKLVEGIHSTLLNQSQIDRDQSEENRRVRENLRRSGREEKLEERKNAVMETAKKILAPFQSIFDRILRFLVFTILGRSFKVFMDWASDPKNKDKLETIGRFLKDWWPALLGAWFLFATPIGRFTRTIIGTVAKLSLKLAKFAIPKLVSFAKSNPLIAAGAITGISAGAGYMMEQNRTSGIAKQQATVPEKRGNGNLWNEIGKSFNPGQPGMGGVSPLGFSKGGFIPSVFSGVVDRDTGTTVSGAGPDTQFLPVENGGGAVLQRGEVVLQKGARERMIKEQGIDPLAYNIGSNANKPRNISSNVLGRAYGGLIGLSNGGAIGIAAHHLKQDEALSSLTPGTNDFTRPGSQKWSKVTVNTPIHSYIDSVGQPTIGWGSTFYDNILNGKKPVKTGDKITKGKADNILSTNISGLQKEYSTKIPNWNKMTEKQRAGLLVLGYNAPYGPIGAYKKLTNALREGNISSAAQNLQRGGPNPQRIALEKSLLMSGPLNLKNLVGPKIMGEKKVGSGIPGIPPFLYNMNNKPTGKKDGGSVENNVGGRLIKNTDGIRNPHSASDPMIVALRPREYVFTPAAVEKIGNGSSEKGAKILDTMLALLDKNSKPAKQNYIPEPPTKNGKNGIVNLPPIKQTSMAGSTGGSLGAGSNVPSFSIISSVAQSIRIKNAEIYGIV